MIRKSLKTFRSSRILFASCSKFTVRGNGARIRCCGRGSSSWISRADCRPRAKNSFPAGYNVVPDTKGVMRIVMNALSARQGGGQTYVSNLLESLPEQLDTEVFVLAPDSLPLPRGKSNLQRIPVTWLVENPYVRAVWEKLCLAPLLKRLGADVLFCPGGIVGTRVPAGCKTVTMFRNMI